MDTDNPGMCTLKIIDGSFVNELDTICRIMFHL